MSFLLPSSLGWCSLLLALGVCYISDDAAFSPLPFGKCYFPPRSFGWSCLYPHPLWVVLLSPLCVVLHSLLRLWSGAACFPPSFRWERFSNINKFLKKTFIISIQYGQKLKKHGGRNSTTPKKGGRQNHPHRDRSTTAPPKGEEESSREERSPHTRVEEKHLQPNKRREENTTTQKKEGEGSNIPEGVGSGAGTGAGGVCLCVCATAARPNHLRVHAQG